MNERTEPDGREERRASRWTWITPLAALAGLVALWFLVPGFREFGEKAWSALTSDDRERVERWVAGYGGWGVVVVLGLMFFQTIVAFLPSLLPMVVAVLAYGPFAGGALAWAGLVAAAALGYGIGRSIGAVSVDRILGSKTERRMERFVARYGVWGVVAARVSPVLSTDAVSIVGGVARMGFLRFLVATAIGTLPLTILVAWLGRDIDRLKSGLVWISVASLTIFLVWVIRDHRRRRNRSPDD